MFRREKYFVFFLDDRRTGSSMFAMKCCSGRQMLSNYWWQLHKRFGQEWKNQQLCSLVYKKEWQSYYFEAFNWSDYSIPVFLLYENEAPVSLQISLKFLAPSSNAGRNRHQYNIALNHNLITFQRGAFKFHFKTEPNFCFGPHIKTVFF